MDIEKLKEPRSKSQAGAHNLYLHDRNFHPARHWCVQHGVSMSRLVDKLIEDFVHEMECEEA